MLCYCCACLDSVWGRWEYRRDQYFFFHRHPDHSERAPALQEWVHETCGHTHTHTHKTAVQRKDIHTRQTGETTLHTNRQDTPTSVGTIQSEGSLSPTIWSPCIAHFNYRNTRLFIYFIMVNHNAPVLVQLDVQLVNMQRSWLHWLH